MIKKIVLIATILVLSLLIVLELLLPTFIEKYVGQEVQQIGIDEFDMELTSKRPYLLRFIRNDLSGSVTTRQYSTVITFERIQARFNNYGIKSGDISFLGTVSEVEVEKLVKAQWGEEIDVILSQGYISITMPINLYFTQLDSSIKGVFNVKDNNEVIFEIVEIDKSIPGFDKQVRNFLNSRDMSFSLQDIPNIHIESIDIQEGQLVVAGIIQ